MIELGREINSYAPEKSDGGKVKLGVHADQGQILKMLGIGIYLFFMN